MFTFQVKELMDLSKIPKILVWPLSGILSEPHQFYKAEFSANKYMLHSKVILWQGVWIRCMGAPPSFSVMFSKGDVFLTTCLLTCRTKSSQKGSTLKGKNLLQWEQILSFMR